MRAIFALGTRAEPFFVVRPPTTLWATYSSRTVASTMSTVETLFSTSWPTSSEVSLSVVLRTPRAVGMATCTLMKTDSFEVSGPTGVTSVSSLLHPANAPSAKRAARNLLLFIMLWF